MAISLTDQQTPQRQPTGADDISMQRKQLRKLLLNTKNQLLEIYRSDRFFAGERISFCSSFQSLIIEFLLTNLCKINSMTDK